MTEVMKRTNHHNTVFYIDPASMLNLAKYDYYLLQECPMPIHYFCSKYYDFKTCPSLHYHRVFAYYKLKRNWQKAISYTFAYLLILFNVARLRPNVVHIQWFRIPKFDYVMVRIMQRFFGVNVIFTAHNLLPHDTGDRHRAVFTKAYKAFDSIIVHSQTTKDQLVAEFHINPEKVKVIRHGILPFTVSDEKYKECESFYEQKYQLKGKLAFSALGFQDHYKGTDLLAKVWAETPELCNNSNCRLVIVGKVKSSELDLSMLKGLNNVVFENRKISDEEFLYLLRHTSLYVLPYRNISQSGALLTAIAEHIPVLVSDIGALTEPLTIANIGWNMGQPTYENLRKAILYIMGHPEAIETIKHDEKAWQRLADNYSWKHIGEKTTKLYMSHDYKK